MAKIPSISEMQKLTESSHLQMVDVEREKICKEIEKAANKGHHYLYIDTDIFNENIELLKNEGYEVRRKCNEWNVGTVISWYPGAVKKKNFNIRAQFIGEDGSMGFRRGQWYEIIATEKRLGKVLVREAGGLFCPYSNWGKMLENWKFDNRY